MIKAYETMAMLDLPDNEREMLGKCFEELSESFAAIDQVDTDGAKPLATVLDLYNVLREDAAKKLLTRQEILSNAPEQHDGYFKVPGTL